MSATGLAGFDEKVQKTNTSLKETAQALSSVWFRIYQALSAVLHCLRDRQAIDEAAQRGDQPEKIRLDEDFLSRRAIRPTAKCSLFTA